MDTKGQIRITIDGASLTDDEKKEIIEQVRRKLNGENEKEQKFAIKEKSKFKEMVDDVVWKLGVKKDMMVAGWRNMSDSTKLMVITVGIPVLTKTALAVVNEVRLVAKEHRLEEQHRMRTKGC